MQNEQALFPDRCWPMRSKAPLLAAALLAFLTAGCAESTYMHTHYSPSAPGGSSAKSTTGEQHISGTGDYQRQILFQRQGVIVGADIVAQGEGKAGMLITFEVPEGRVVTFVDKKVEISAANHVATTGMLSGGRTALGFDGWSGAKYSDFSPDTPMTGTTAKEKRFGHGQGTQSCLSDYAMFCFITDLSVPVSGPFTVKMPRFSVNGAETELPLIAVTQEKKNEIGDNIFGIMMLLGSGGMGMPGG